MRWCAEDLGLSLRWHPLVVSIGEAFSAHLPFGGGAGWSLSFAQKAIDIV